MERKEFVKVARKWLAEVSPTPWEAIVWPQRSKWAQLWKLLRVFFATWRHSGSREYFEIGATLPDGTEVAVCHTGAGPTSEKNAMFIAWVINNFPAILDELEKEPEPVIARKQRWA